MENADSSFGNWLKQRRKALDLTQEGLAEQVACSVITIRKIEGNIRRPSKQIIDRLADALAISGEERQQFVALGRRPIGGIHKTESAVHPSPSHNLPPQATPFIGRSTQLLQIADYLSQPDCRLLTLLGSGGIGKTRLALQAAAQQIDSFASGVCFVNATPISASDLLPIAILDALKIPNIGSSEPLQKVIGYLRNQNLLLVLDNLEHVLDGIEILAEILANAPYLKMLVTSRERLNLREEWVLPVEGMAYPANSYREGANDDEALQLFEHHARRIQPTFNLNNNLNGVIEICRAVEGMPLGLELAAAWLRTMPCDEIAGQLTRDVDFLSLSARNLPDRHHSLRAVFDHSWKLLTDSEREVLTKLSVFRGGWDAEAAHCVANATPHLLAGLVDKSLVRAQTTGRYDLHELFRQYAATKLSAYDTVLIQQRHFEYFLSLAEQAEPELRGGQNQMAWCERFQVETYNLRAALTWASHHINPELMLRMAGALGMYWRTRHIYREGYEWLSQALAKEGETASLLRIKALYYICDCALHFPGNVQHAIELGETALILARHTENPVAIAKILSALGHIVAIFDGQLERGKTLLEEAATLSREVQNEPDLLDALNNLGLTLINLGDYEQANTIIEEALNLCRKMNFDVIAAWQLFHLSSAAFAQGDLQRTATWLDQSLHIFERTNDEGGLAAVWLRQGDIAQSTGDFVRAKNYYLKVMISSKMMDVGWRSAHMLIRLGSLFASKLPVEAVNCFAAGVAYNEAMGHVSFNTHDHFRNNIEFARTSLGDDLFNQAYEQGRQMTLDEAVACAQDHFQNSEPTIDVGQ